LATLIYSGPINHLLTFQPLTSDQFLLPGTSSPLLVPYLIDDSKHLAIIGFHGPTSKNAAHHAAWDTVEPSRALYHHQIPHVLWGDFLWIAAFRVPTACLHTIYFVVPKDRVDAAVKAISADLPYYKRSPATDLVLPSSGCPADFPDIPILKYPPFRIGIIPGNLVAFDPTDTARTTTIECDHTSVPVPTLPGLLDSCADVSRIHRPRLPKRLGMDELVFGTHNGGS